MAIASIETELATLRAGNFVAFTAAEFAVIQKAAYSARDAEAVAWQTLLAKINALS